MIEFEQEKKERAPIATIKVIGVGGAGGNTVNSIIDSGYQGIEFIVANTDAQALIQSKAETKIQIGVKSTKGLGTGANPDLGKRAAEEDLDKILESIGTADIVFLAGGMGGGTGSGALPVIAHALKEKNILSIAIVTKPFQFEGKRRAAVAERAIDALRKEVDTLLIVPNQKLLDLVDQHVSMIDAFAMINDLLCQSVKGISDIITKPGHINVDFSDVRAIMKDMGLAVMGTGKASGENRAKAAALQAISSPLLENMNIEGAHGVLFNITGGKGLSLYEVSQAASVIYEQAHEEANIILGSVVDETMGDEVSVTIIATGFSRTVCAEKIANASAEQRREKLQTSKEIFFQEQEIQEQEAQELKEVLEVATISSEQKLELSAPEDFAAASEAMLSQSQPTTDALAVLEKLIVSGDSNKSISLSLHENLTHSETIQPAQIVEAKQGEVSSEEKNSASEANINTSQEVCSASENNREDVQALKKSKQEDIAQEFVAAGIDMNDLDVPTFLRTGLQEHIGIK